MISVLIPSRDRVKLLKRTVESIWNMSSSMDVVEIVFRVDEDDQKTIDYLNELNHLPNVRVLVGLRKSGYRSSSSFFNEMAAVSKGNLLMCCNDDAIFKTKDWDKIIEDVSVYYHDGIFNIGVDTVIDIEDFAFSIVSKRWVEIVGYLHDPHLSGVGADWFLKRISDNLGRSIYLPEVVIEHDWAGDDTQWYGSEMLDEKGRLRREYKGFIDRAVSEATDRLRLCLDLDIMVKRIHTLRNSVLKSMQKGRCYFQDDLYREAIEEFDKALVLEKDADINVKGKILFYKGMAHFRLQRYKKAMELLEESLRFDLPPKESIVAHYTLGSQYQKRKEMEKAIERFNQVLSLKTRSEEIYHGGAYFHLGKIYQDQGRLEQARRNFEFCLRLNPSHHEAKRNLDLITKVRMRGMP